MAGDAEEAEGGLSSAADVVCKEEAAVKLSKDGDRLLRVGGAENIAGEKGVDRASTDEDAECKEGRTGCVVVERPLRASDGTSS